MQAGSIRAGRAFVELNADNSKFNRALRNAESRLKKFGNRLQEIGRGMMNVGTLAAVPLGVSTKLFASFDDQMRTVKAVTGATGEEFDKLTERAKKLGRTTSFTASQVAGAMVELGRMGFNPGEIDNSIQGILDLARATRTDLAESALIASGTLRAFGLDASKMGKVVDVLTATANNSAQTLTELGESMKYAAPVADEFGLSLEETAKSIGTLAQFSIRGTMAGTSMRNIMLRMARSPIRKILKEQLNVDTADEAGNLRSLSDIMFDLGKALGKVKPVKRIELLDQVFGMRAITGGAKLTTKTFEDLNKAIDNFDGTARKTAAEMDAGIGGAFRRLWSAVEGTALAVGNQLAKPISYVSELFTKFNGTLTTWIEKNGTLIRVVGIATAGLLGMGAAIYTLGFSLKLAAKSFGVMAGTFSIAVKSIKLLGAAIALLSNPFVAAAAVAGTFAVVLSNVSGVTDKVIQFIVNKLGDLKDKFSKVMEAIKKALAEGDLGKAANIMWLTLKLAWTKGVNGLIGIWHGLWKEVLTKGNDMWTGLVSAWHIAIKEIRLAASEGWAGMLSGWYLVQRGIETGIINLWREFDNLWAKSKNGLKKWYADITYWIGWHYAEMMGKFDKDFDTQEVQRQLYKETQGDKGQSEAEYRDKLKEANQKYDSMIDAVDRDFADNMEKVLTDSARREEEINREFNDNLSNALEKGNARQREINDRYLKRMAALKEDIEKARAELNAEVSPEGNTGKQTQKVEDRIAAARERLTKAETALQKARDRRGLENDLQGVKDPKERRRMRMSQVLGEKEALMEYRNAQKELRDAVSARRGIGTGPEQKAGRGRIRERKTPADLMADAMRGIMGVQTAQVAGVSLMRANAAGAFSGFSRFGTQGDASTQRMASGIEEIAKNTRDLLNETRDSDEEIV